MEARVERLLERIGIVCRLLAFAGAAFLLALVGLVCSGVVMRYVFAAPLLGVNEIVQLTAVLLVAAALPWCTHSGVHVAVDVFERPLGPVGRHLGDLAWHLLAAVVLFELSRRAGLKAADARAWGDATNMLQLPVWPFYAALAGGAGLTLVVVVLRGTRILLRGPA